MPSKPSRRKTAADTLPPASWPQKLARNVAAELKNAPLNSIGVVVGLAGLIVSLREVFLGSDTPPSVGPQVADPENLIRWIVLIACVSFVLAAVGSYVYRNKKIVGALLIVGLSIPTAFLNSYITYKVLGGFSLVPFDRLVAPTTLGKTEIHYKIAGIEIDTLAGIAAFSYIVAVVYFNAASVARYFGPLFEDEMSKSGGDDFLAYMYWFTIIVIAPMIASAILSYNICVDMVLGLLLPPAAVPTQS